MSKTLDILDSKGVRVGEYVIPETALELEKGEQAVRDAVVAFLAEQRAGTASTKTRGEVRGGGAKPFRQKGTGRARAGSSRSPIWLGGGVIFGPQPRSYAKKVNKKIAALALKRAFSERIVEGDIVVVDKFDLVDHKTKNAKAILDALKVNERSVLLSVAEFDECTVCATGNLPNVALRKSQSVNVYELLRFNKLVFTKEGLDLFIERLG
ncbi:MAG: 50S ribosomal protein L4 [Lentisphaeria bacterium]|nr:50S ribosomal protein L4 [Lentisphaeria bacterium]MBR7127911.1 50S ribosomal protein L4 [Lentisphaeria bacterium]